MKLLAPITSIGLLLAVLLLAGARQFSIPAPDSPAPATAPDFTLQSLDGERYTLSKLRGKVVLVNFWATWCPPCRQEIPALTRLHSGYKERDFMVLGISLDDLSPEQIKNFARNYKISYPVLHGPRSELSAITRAYGGIQAVPTSFLIDKQGNIRAQYIGARSEQAFLADIKPLL